MSTTSAQFDSSIKKCKDIFIKKMHDYGTAWRILRTQSITDQLYIKAQRIRSIEQKGMQKINEDVQSEYIGLVNYSIIGLIQLTLNEKDELELPVAKAEKLYDQFANMAKELMENKNHDYSEAWRDMRISSLTDLILMKLMRTKQIEDNKGISLISEGIDANYLDILNYSVFALIRLDELKSTN